MADDPTTRATPDGEGPDRPDRPTDTAPRSPETRERPAPSPPVPLTQVVGRIVLLVIALLFLIFAVVNRQPVDFSWVFGETEVLERGGEHVGGGVPLIVLLIGSFVLGAVVSAGLLWRQRRVRRGRHAGEREAPDA